MFQTLHSDATIFSSRFPFLDSTRAEPPINEMHTTHFLRSNFNFQESGMPKCTSHISQCLLRSGPLQPISAASKGCWLLGPARPHCTCQRLSGRQQPRY